MEATEDWAPWLKARGGNPKRVIASLEMLATLVAVKIWQWKEDGGLRIHAEAFTDNRRNDFALEKGMSTKLPMTLMIMELAETMRRHDPEVQLTWVSMNDNVAADDLTNLVFDKFDAGNRVMVEGKELKWLALDDLMKKSALLYEEIQVRKRENKKSQQSLGGCSKAKKLFGRWSTG